MRTTQVILLEVAFLHPLEGNDWKRVKWLFTKITEEGFWTAPLRVEQSRYLVMDGHHRFEVAKLMGLHRVPVELFGYDEVDVFSLRKNIEVTPEIIFKNADEGIVFPYKTAQHKFPSSLENFKEIPINDLK